LSSASFPPARWTAALAHWSVDELCMSESDE
jgi:hypothetical protein